MNATVEYPQPGHGELKLLSAQGRVGRMRYIAWSFAISFALGLLAALGGTALGMVAGPFGMVFVALICLAMLIVVVLITIQRCHDFNATGWLAMILLVPLAPLVFWLIPGTQGANRYGPPPPPNTIGVKVLFWLVVVLTVLGILGSVVAPTSMMSHMGQVPPPY